MYAKVIPALKLPKNFGTFDYIIPDNLLPQVTCGSWVIVPWRKNLIAGIVIDVKKNTDFEHKKLKSIIGFGHEKPLNNNLYLLPEIMSDYYFCSASSIVKTFLPPTPKSKIITESAPNKDRNNFRTNSEFNFSRYRSGYERDKLILSLTKKTISAGQSVIIVVPHVTEIERTRNIFTNSPINFEPILLHGGQTGPTQKKSWSLIMSSTVSLVIGSRLSAFAPAQNIGLFIIVESDSPDLRQYDQNPRYDVRDIANWRAKLCGANVHYLSHTPRLEEYIYCNDKTTAQKTTVTSQPTLINTSGNPNNRESVLSLIVENKISDSLRIGKKVLIYHNRLGSAGALICADCKTVIRCKTCGIALSVNKSNLRCGRCHATAEIPTSCSNCHGINFVKIGTGIEKIVNTLSEKYPNKKIFGYGSEQSEEDKTKALAEGDVIIGTKLLLHDISETPSSINLGLIVATEINDLLAHPGFRINEDAWRTIRLLKHIAGETNAVLALQTVDPDNEKVKNLLLSFDNFAKTELIYRKALNYPPFGNIITVTVKTDTETESEKLIRGLKSKLETELKSDDIKISGPIKHRLPLRDKKWRSLLAIKTTNPSAKLTTILKSLPENYIIDRNPESIG